MGRKEHASMPAFINSSVNRSVVSVITSRPLCTSLGLYSRAAIIISCRVWLQYISCAVAMGWKTVASTGTLPLK